MSVQGDNLSPLYVCKVGWESWTLQRMCNHSKSTWIYSSQEKSRVQVYPMVIILRDVPFHQLCPKYERCRSRHAVCNIFRGRVKGGRYPCLQIVKILPGSIMRHSIRPL